MVNLRKNVNHSVDRGWAWIILMASFLNLFMCSMIYTSGLFNVIFIEMFDESKALIAWCTALPHTLLNLAAPFAGYLCSRIGPRLTIIVGGSCVCLGLILTYNAQTFTHVFITYGFLAGFGYSLCCTPALIIHAYYFDKYRAVAYSIAITGVGVGAMVMPPFIEYLISIYGFHGSVLILGAMSGHFYVCGLLTRPVSNFTRKSEKKTPCYTEPDLIVSVNSNTGSTCTLALNVSNNVNDIASVNVTANRKPRFTVLIYKNGSSHQSTDWDNSNMNITQEKTKGKSHIDSWQLKKLLNSSYLLFLVQSFLMTGGMASIYVHFAAYAMVKGSSIDQVSFLLTTMGVGNILSRLVPGLISRNNRALLYITYISSEIGGGILSFSGLLICDTYIGQHVFALLWSSLGWSYFGLLLPIIIDINGVETSNMSFSISTMVCGLGILAFPPLAGLVFDITNSYVYTFIIGGACEIISGLIMILIVVLQRNKR